MIQWLGIVAGLFAMLAAALLFGESSQGGSTAGISGFPHTAFQWAYRSPWML